MASTQIAPTQSHPGNTVSAAPVKQFEVHRSSAWNTKRHEIKQNGNTVLYTNRKKAMFSSPQINLQTSDQQILASIKMQSFSKDLLLHLGNPDCTDKAQWANLTCDNFMATKYKFGFGGRWFTWTRTHNKDLGASKFGGSNFKLVDESNGCVVMVYRYTNGLFSGGVVGNIDFYAELDPQLELLALAAIVGIEERIAMRKRNAGAAGGAGGGGGGG